jgi:hypothetical protein
MALLPQTVNDSSTAYLSVTFTDKTGVAVAPSTVNYTIHDVTSNTQVKASTSVSPSATVEITILPSENAILDTAQNYEMRRVTVIAAYGGSDQVTDEYTYRVKNLRNVT